MKTNSLLISISVVLILCASVHAQDDARCVVEASEMSMQAITTKNYTPVIQKASECIQKYPHMLGAYSTRGNAYLEKGDLDLAIKDLTRYIELQIEDIEWYRKEFGEAANGSEYVNEGTTGLILGYYSRSKAYLKKPDVEKARADLRAALTLNPKNEETKRKIAELDKLPPQSAAAPTVEQFTALGRRQAGQKDYDGAIKSFTECLRLKPDADACYAFRGSVYGVKGNMDLATADFEKAIKISPNEPRIYLMRATMFATLGKKEQAVADFRAVLKIDPNNRQAQQALQQLGAQP